MADKKSVNEILSCLLEKVWTPDTLQQLLKRVGRNVIVSSSFSCHDKVLLQKITDNMDRFMYRGITSDAIELFANYNLSINIYGFL